MCICVANAMLVRLAPVSAQVKCTLCELPGRRGLRDNYMAHGHLVLAARLGQQPPDAGVSIGQTVWRSDVLREGGRLALEVLAQVDALQNNQSCYEFGTEHLECESSYRQHTEHDAQHGAQQHVPPVVTMVDDAREATEARPEEQHRLDGGHEQATAQLRHSSMNVPAVKSGLIDYFDYEFTYAISARRAARLTYQTMKTASKKLIDEWPDGNDLELSRTTYDLNSVLVHL